MLKFVGGLGIVMGMILLMEMGNHGVAQVRMMFIHLFCFIITGQMIFSGGFIIRIKSPSRTPEREDKIEHLDQTS